MATNPSQGAFVTLTAPMLVCNAEDFVRRIDGAGATCRRWLRSISYSAPA